MSKHHHCCDEEVKVESLTLGDGRQAERHVSHNDDGHEVIEVFAEEARPLKLEKRIVRKHKKIVAEERHETVRDGEVVEVEVLSLEPKQPMQVVEHLGVADHAKVVDGDYVRKEEVSKLVSDAVVAGVSVLMDGYEPVHEEHHHHHHDAPEAAEPVFAAAQAAPLKAQSEVQQHVAEKKKGDGTVNAIMGGIVLVQIIFFAYMLIFVL